MSGNPQLGMHPDAEMLNAFAEQALPGQERQQVAAHLAVCGRCRDVVFLAQEASVEMEDALVAAVAAPAASQRMAEPVPYAAKAPRFVKWRLAWIPAAALAAGISVAYIVHIRHQEPAGQMAKAENQAAPVSAVPLAPPPPAETAKSAEVAPKQAERAMQKTRGLAAMQSVPASPLPPPSVNVPVQTDQSVTVAAGDALELKTVPDGVAAERQQVLSQAAGAPQEPAAKKAAPTSANEEKQTEDRLEAVAAAPMMQAEVMTAPAARSAARDVHGVGGSLATYTSRPVALPSGLASISMAVVKQSVLAVDKAGSVFLSTDDGAHWESIRRQWNGQAVAVRSVAGPKDKSAGKGGTVQAGFELVNDAGQVWVSADGRSWKSK